MPKVQLPHDPDLTRDRLKRVLEAELGSKYEIRDRGEKRLVIKSSDWYGVVVGITQKPNKGETTVAVGRLIPEFKNILMLLPLLLIALVPFYIVLLLLLQKGKPTEHDVVWALEHAEALHATHPEPIPHATAD